MKGKQLLDGGVEGISFAQNDESSFFVGLVSAAMKKSVKYGVELVVFNNGEVKNSECECPAGVGPFSTCKHVAAVLFLLSKFCADGSLCIAQSCTETLQTFQKPSKIHQGSPMKACELGDDKSLFNKDPRPLKFKDDPCILENAKNLTSNFVYQTKLDLAYIYTFPRANLHSSIFDHCYLSRPFPEYWILNANKVTKEIAIQIEESTRMQSKSLTWFKKRKHRLTASNFGDIFKVSEQRDLVKMCDNLYSR